MSSTNPCDTHTITANADVLGHGVRVNFYFTMILLAVIPRMPSTKELLNALYATAGFSGLGLLLTAIIQTALNQLSVFEGLFVLHVLFFLSIGAAPSGKYHWSRSRIAMGVFIQFASVTAFAGWGLYFWIHVKHFGTKPGCNFNDEVKYVIMFKTVPATAPWLRGLWIAAIVASTVGLMVGFVHTAVKLFVLRGEEEEEGGAEQENYFQLSILLFLSSIYAITTLELMVHRNTAHLSNGTNLGPGVVQIDDSWQFGQILSVVMIVANVNEFAHFLFGYLARQRRDRLDRAREGQEQAVELEAAPQPPPPRGDVAYRPRGPAGSSSSSRGSRTGESSSESELHDLNKGSVEVSQTIVDQNTPSHDFPIGTLR